MLNMQNTVITKLAANATMYRLTGSHEPMFVYRVTQ